MYCCVKCRKDNIWGLKFRRRIFRFKIAKIDLFWGYVWGAMSPPPLGLLPSLDTPVDYTSLAYWKQYRLTFQPLTPLQQAPWHFLLKTGQKIFNFGAISPKRGEIPKTRRQNFRIFSSLWFAIQKLRVCYACEGLCARHRRAIGLLSKDRLRLPKWPAVEKCQSTRKSIRDIWLPIRLQYTLWVYFAPFGRKQTTSGLHFPSPATQSSITAPTEISRRTWGTPTG